MKQNLMSIPRVKTTHKEQIYMEEFAHGKMETKCTTTKVSIAQCIIVYRIQYYRQLHSADLYNEKIQTFNNVTTNIPALEQ